MKSLKSLVMAGALLASSCPMFTSNAGACSRVLYQGADSLYIVARSLDWRTPIPTNLYIYPQGMIKQSSDQPDHVSWISKYGSVYAVGYDGGVTEGMNEKGLVINGLFCKGTVYNDDASVGKTQMSMSMFVAWLLDLNATTDEVIQTLKEWNFDIQGATFDGGTVSALHWGVTDTTGKSIIFEFDRGKINIYDMGDYLAMTNDPNWPKMTAIIDYWDRVGGKNMLPGTVTSPDRCVRANYFAHHVKKTGDADLGASIARTILMNSCVPYTYEIAGEPNLSSTQWRSLANTRDLRYYFDMVTNPGMYYVDLNKVNLKKGAPVLKLDTSNTANLVGDVTKDFKKSAPFTPMY